MTRWKQLIVVAVGLGLAAAMAVLGVWQLDVYRSQGADLASARAAAAPVDLRQVAPAGDSVRDGYGRSVSFTGQYEQELELLIPLETDTSAFRVLTGLRQSDGSVVPVVRGVVRGDSAPPPPAGPVSQVGVLLPSEDNAPASTSDQLNAVRLPALAQRWSGQLVGGFVTLSAADAAAQGIEPAPLNLPQAEGRLRNAAYALQWWVFGAFAVALAVRMARDLGLRDDLDAVEITDDVRASAT